jgi:hypothetical protein
VRKLGTHAADEEKKKLEERSRKMQRRVKKEGGRKGRWKADLAVTGALGEILAASLFLRFFLL